METAIAITDGVAPATSATTVKVMATWLEIVLEEQGREVVVAAVVA